MFHEHMGYGIIAKCISAYLLKLNKTPLRYLETIVLQKVFRVSWDT